MDVSYYPGCTLTGSARELDESFKNVAEKLGITLSELPDWTCCGASSAHMVDAYLESALPARDLLVAEKIGKDVVAPCAACHLRLKHAAHKIKEDDNLKAEFPFKGEIKILSGLQLFDDAAVRSKLKELVVKPLEGLRVVPYYGCLAVRPPEIVEPDDPENPMQMDRVLTALGAEVIDWPYKTDCCGGSLALARTDLVKKLSKKLFDMAMTVEADLMVTFCPMCHANLDTRQGEISQESGSRYEMPIAYVTELMGLALGNPHAAAWFGQHMVSPAKVLQAKGLM